MQFLARERNIQEKRSRGKRYVSTQSVCFSLLPLCGTPFKLLAQVMPIETDKKSCYPLRSAKDARKSVANSRGHVKIRSSQNTLYPPNT